MTSERERWYDGITRYQWTVLAVASLGWIFDVFEGQIFVASMNEAIPSLEPEASEDTVRLYNNVALGAFLLGGAVGGIAFGALSDRIGRKRTLSLTIAFYSVFTCISALSAEWWHLAAFRFLVALGVGGEWAVASALVAEVFPRRARAHVGGIFHASSVFGVYLATAAGTFLIANPALNAWAEELGMPSLVWRLGFALGALPALLIIWIRRSIREPECWESARDRDPAELGRLRDLFQPAYLRGTLVGVSLATIGMATFWGVHIYGKDALAAQIAEGTDPLVRKRWEMLGMLLQATGGGIGLFCFGPISQRIGRKAAFALYHAGALVATIGLFWLLEDTGVPAVLVALPIFGFLTIGMHAGYAIYFPELFPTRLRGAGTGFCFNAGRILAAPILVVTAALAEGHTTTMVACMLSPIYLLGLVAIVFARETRGEELPG